MSYANIILQQMKPIVQDLPAHSECYTSSNMAVFRPDAMYKGPARFDSYECVLNFGFIPDVVVENKIYTVKKDHAFIVNPMESHGVAREELVNCYMPLFIERSIFEENAYAIAGKSSIQFSNEPFQYQPQLVELLHSFAYESRMKQLGFNFVMQSMTTQLVAHFIRNVKSSLSVGNQNLRYKDRKNINIAIEFLWENYNMDISFEEVAKTVNYSPYHFIRIFKDVTGKTPHEYLVDIKIQKAISKLKNSKDTITEICFSCGFNNLNHFSSLFRKKVGISPSEYRKTKG